MIGAPPQTEIEILAERGNDLAVGGLREWTMVLRFIGWPSSMTHQQPGAVVTCSVRRSPALVSRRTVGFGLDIHYLRGFPRGHLGDPGFDLALSAMVGEAIEIDGSP